MISNKGTDILTVPAVIGVEVWAQHLDPVLNGLVMAATLIFVGLGIIIRLQEIGAKKKPKDEDIDER